ncbi:MAG: thioredoxin family protein [Candidatus Babeliales bacterium]|nr:thioredoxin family protein [Candidatus Babeliales bacterium]
MKIFIRYLVIFTIITSTLLAYYFFKHNNNIEVSQSKSNQIIDLEDSTKIILSLIRSNKLAEVLDLENDQSKHTVDLLIENYSPAQLALESEALSQSYPVLLIFFKDEHWKIIEPIVTKHIGQIKIIKINADNLFKTTQEFEIKYFPTFLIMQSRQEINRLENLDEYNFKLFLETIIL